MKQVTFNILIFLSLAGCTFICPKKYYVKFDILENSISTKSENFYINKVEIVEYIDKTQYIEPIDSTRTIISLKKEPGLCKLYIHKISIDYIILGNQNPLLNKKNLQFTVEIKKIKKLSQSDYDTIGRIIFVRKDAKTKETLFSSNAPCP